jgi:hypothetical protein
MDESGYLHSHKFFTPYFARKNTMFQVTTGQIYDEKMLADLTELQLHVLELVELKKYSQELQRLQKQEKLYHQVAEGMQKLESHAERINLLADKLEFEILQFKEIALEINQSYQAIQQPLELKTPENDELKRFRCRPLNIWEVHYSKVPTVIRHNTRFVLTAKTIDLFKAQGELEFQKKIKAAQSRREAFESWLVQKK